MAERSDRSHRRRDSSVSAVLRGGVRRVLRIVTGVVAGTAAVALFPASAEATETFSRDTLRPLLLKDVNSLIGNHYFIQSMLAFDSTPFTIGISTQQARANYQRSDGVEYKGGLTRVGEVLSLGFGRPASGFAIYGVLNVNGVLVNAYPFPFADSDEAHITAKTYGVVAAAGLAYKGWVAQFGVHYTASQMDADGIGRLSSCTKEGFCAQGINQRPGAPLGNAVRRESTSLTNKLIILENASGYSVGALFGSYEQLQAWGERRAKTELASLRALAQPNNLLPRAVGLIGAGITTYAPDIDYYGDRIKEARAAVARGQSVPTSSKTMVEVPFVGDRLAGTGALARLVVQGYPSPNFRLAEAGYVFQGDETASFLPQAGARAKVFRRGDGVTGSTDIFAGFFWVFSQSNRAQQGRGLSMYLTYSYNSPDSSNFVPLSDAHVLGAQIVFGNPSAMPPPVPSVKYPSSASRVDEGKP